MLMRAEAASGLPADVVRSLARDLVTTEAAALYGRLGVSTQEFGSVCQWAIQCLNIVCGNLDHEGGVVHWNRVHRLPDFVYFNHAIHVKQGVGCATCHGPVDKMPLMLQHASLQMEWCIDCHRAPEQYLRPKEEVFNMAYEAPANQLELGNRLKQEYGIAGPDHLTACSTCHR